jgi:hypothetical protein
LKVDTFVLEEHSASRVQDCGGEESVQLRLTGWGKEITPNWDDGYDGYQTWPF